MPKIMEDEWVKELERLSARNDAGMTTVEWKKKLGRSNNYVMRMLHEARDRGWLRVGKQSRQGLDGRCFSATVYSIARPKRRS